MKFREISGNFPLTDRPNLILHTLPHKLENLNFLFLAKKAKFEKYLIFLANKNFHSDHKIKIRKKFLGKTNHFDFHSQSESSICIGVARPIRAQYFH